MARAPKEAATKVVKRDHKRTKVFTPLQEWYIGDYLTNNPEGESLDKQERLQVIRNAYKAAYPDASPDEIPKFSDGWYSGFKKRFYKMEEDRYVACPQLTMDFSPDAIRTPTDLVKMDKFCKHIKPGMSPETVVKVVLELKEQITQLTVEKGILQADIDRLLEDQKRREERAQYIKELSSGRVPTEHELETEPYLGEDDDDEDRSMRLELERQAWEKYMSDGASEEEEDDWSSQESNNEEDIPIPAEPGKAFRTGAEIWQKILEMNYARIAAKAAENKKK